MVMHQQIKKLIQERSNLTTDIEKQSIMVSQTANVPPNPLVQQSPPVPQREGDENSMIYPNSFCDSKRRHRRTANEVERHYKCPIPQCDKAYGSEGSLNQHVKLKHPELYYSKSPRPVIPQIKEQTPPAAPPVVTNATTLPSIDKLI